MKKTARQMMDQLNAKLIEHNQQARVAEYSSASIKLVSGTLLSGPEKVKFCKRLLNQKTKLWINNIDNLLNGTKTVGEIKSVLSSIGGKAVQNKYGEHIRKNLNTGRPHNAGTKGQNIGTLGPISQAVKDKISLRNAGANNGMFGKKMSDEDKLMRSNLMRDKILKGIFTPNSNNRNTHWNVTLDNKKYRSSWEALYQYINPTAEYEALRIEYNFAGSRKIYIVDFIDHINKVVVEIKPRELCVGEKFNAKIQALTSWANSNDYSVLIVTKEWLQEQTVVVGYDRFDKNTASKIKALYETNQKNRN